LIDFWFRIEFINIIMTLPKEAVFAKNKKDSLLYHGLKDF
jgi:hypothetical protein